MNKGYFENRIAKATEDLQTLESVKLNYKHLLVETLKNRIQEWRDSLEELDNQ
jgi:hypothetical protein